MIKGKYQQRNNNDSQKPTSNSDLGLLNPNTLPSVSLLGDVRVVRLERVCSVPDFCHSREIDSVDYLLGYCQMVSLCQQTTTAANFTLNHKSLKQSYSEIGVFDTVGELYKRATKTNVPWLISCVEKGEYVFSVTIIRLMEGHDWSYTAYRGWLA